MFLCEGPDFVVGPKFIVTSSDDDQGHDYIVDPNFIEGIWVQHSAATSTFTRNCNSELLEVR